MQMLRTMNSKLGLGAAVLSLSALAPSAALAEAGYSVNAAGNPADVTANVNFRIVIPNVLVFKVGSLGSMVNTVTWATEFNGMAGDAGAAPSSLVENEDYSGDIPATTEFSAADVDDDNDEGGSAEGALEVYAFSNAGDINIEITTANDLSDGALVSPVTIDIDNISVSSGASHPTLLGDTSLVLGKDSTVTATGGIASLDTSWVYVLDPTAIDGVPAGTYDGDVVYTASSP